MDMYTSKTSSARSKVIASKPAPTVNRAHPRNHIDRQSAIAGKPAPTGDLPAREMQKNKAQRQPGRLSGRLALALAVDLLAPSRGRAQVLRSGQPGKDAGLAAPGHGWPMAAGPRSRTGARACRAQARHRTKGARAFGYFALLKVTRCKSGTLSSHYRSNGYVHQQNFQRPIQSHRWQASSHRNR
jgi:hypothetical protein